jgi:ATP-dependent DNA helicase RecQ
VIHAAMPRSIEHYQQEAGRAGRDGLSAECLLLYSAADYALWRFILTAEGAEPVPGTLRKLGLMYRFCHSGQCRHRALVRYFGQEYRPGSCGACDVCLGEAATMDESLVLAQKILSCVVRLGERFGADYVSEVLRGAGTDRILAAGHDRLSTWGLLKEYPKPVVRDWIEQLVDQGHLARADGKYATLRMTKSGRDLLRGQGNVSLVRPAILPPRRPAPAPFVGEEAPDLFDALRALRRQIARERNVPPYLIFSDATLHEMARLRPLTDAALLAVKGVGERKQVDFGPRFLQLIRDYCGGSPR